MKFFGIFILPLFLSASVSGQDFIYQIKTKTGEDDNDGMGSLGHIDLYVYYPSQGQDHCTIVHLNGEGNDFQPGAIDTFEGKDLQSCEHGVRTRSRPTLFKMIWSLKICRWSKFT